MYFLSTLGWQIRILCHSLVGGGGGGGGRWNSLGLHFSGPSKTGKMPGK